MSGELPFTGFVIPGGGGGGSGDVTGPGSATEDNLASFGDTSGTVLEDSGIAKADVVLNTGSSTDNAAARYDSTTGSLVQDSAFIIGDVSGASLPISTTAGNALAISVTAPAAANGASQAGKGFSVTASNAVASLDTAGAAAGGAVTITSGNAARNTSGNANGGNITLVTGTGIGTGVAGSVVVPAGTSPAPGLLVGSTANPSGLFQASANNVDVAINSQHYFQFNPAALSMRAAVHIGWTSGTDPAVANRDAGFARNAAGVIRATDGSTGIRGFMGGGAAVASASALPVPTGRVFHITGTDNITSITSTNFQAGAVITLIFDDVLTFTDGNNLKLAGNFVTTADDTITLAYDGTNWYECSRSVN